MGRVLTPVEFPRFGGLSVTVDPQEVAGGAAVDMLNIDLSTPGIVRSRPGHQQWASSTVDYHCLQPFYGAPATPEILLAAAGQTIYAYDNTGTAVATKTLTTSATETSMVCLGVGGSTASTAQRVYIATNGEGNIQRFDGSKTFSSTAVTTGRCLGLSKTDNRLAIGGYQGFGTRVAFSDAGNPESVPSTNWVDLEPGDGERITAMANWSSSLFVFKRSKLYVFSGTGIDGSGNPIFNYRSVETGGVGAVSPLGVATAEDGVYFVHSTGVYRTQGGPPVLVSSALNPLFGLGTVSPYYQGGTLSIAEVLWPTVLEVGRNQLYMSAYDTTAGTYRLFVYDFGTSTWSVWDVAARSLAVHRTSPATAQLLFFGDYNGSHLLRVVNPSATQDVTGGVASNITTRYRTGFWNPGQPAAETVVREWLIDGSGTLTWKTAVNDSSTLGTGASVTLGTSPAIAQGRDRRSVMGRNVSFEISGAAPWSVSRVVANLRGQRNAGLKSS